MKVKTPNHTLRKRFMNITLDGGLKLNKSDKAIITPNTTESINIPKYDGPFGVIDTKDPVIVQPVEGKPVVQPIEHSKTQDYTKPNLGVLGLRSVTIPHNINQDSTVEDNNIYSENQNLNSPYNGVSIAQEEVDSYVDEVNALSKDLVEILLSGEAKCLLALESAASYVQALLRDGLGIDAELDTSVMSTISDIGKVAVVFKALKMVDLPSVYKAKFFTTYIEKMAEQSCLTLTEKTTSNYKKDITLKRLRDLEILIKQRQDKLLNSRTITESQQIRQNNRQDTHTPIAGVKKSRK